jgi:hypothetical protein
MSEPKVIVYPPPLLKTASAGAALFQPVFVEPVHQLLFVVSHVPLPSCASAVLGSIAGSLS